MEMSKLAGILLPVASLPGDYGVGDFGKHAYEFVDALYSAGFRLWQILPLNPLGYGHSPYQPFSSFAMDEIYVDLGDLQRRHYIRRPAKSNPLAKAIDYERARAYRAPILREAFETQMKKNPRCLNLFIEENPWVKDWAAFMMFKRRYPASWDSWPTQAREWIKTRPAIARKESRAYKYEIWLQMTLYRQWDALHRYANSKGIEIIGDIPFYVGFDSCDVWANQDCFLLNPVDSSPSFIAGVPPDYFSATGQRWGNPIYDWKHLEESDFRFIAERIVNNAKIYDIIRLDHFRAFDTYWKVPSFCPTAIEGEWIEAPGYAFFDSLFAKYPELQKKLIAEDLGDLRPEVLTLRDHYRFPGMNVVEFTFHDDAIAGKVGYEGYNSVVYLGTHDNDTMKGYFSSLPLDEQQEWQQAIASFGYQDETLVDKFLHFALAKPAKYSILTVQDILNLGPEGRINVPGVVDSINWTYKMDTLKPFKDRVVYLRHLLKATGRAR